jgi:hypothetical protein
MWCVFALLFTSYSAWKKSSDRDWLLTGSISGYLAGIVACQLTPVIKDGSFVRATSTLAAYGLLNYVETSVFYPIVCLSPVVGVLAVLIWGHSCTHGCDTPL